MHVVKCRMYEPKLRPRRTKMDIPGWAGKPEPRIDGSHEYAWHCVPFSESAKYGIELFYPFDNELKVVMRDGRLLFEGDFGPNPGTGIEWPPFRTFGEQFYTYQILLDLKVEQDLALRIEPHPRFYTDPTYTAPIAVPALLRHWWPMMNFVVFKSPAEGQHQIFRPGEPFAQVLVIPAESEFDLVEMTEEEAAERELQSRRIHASRDTLSAETHWTSSTDTAFDGTYRHIHRAAKAKRRENSAPRGS
jgi:hypothetical protein